LDGINKIYKIGLLRRVVWGNLTEEKQTKFPDYLMKTRRFRTEDCIGEGKGLRGNFLVWDNGWVALRNEKFFAADIFEKRG